MAEVERLYGEEERWEGRLEDLFFVEKFRLGLVKGDFWDKSRLNNPEYRTLVALHRRVGEIEIGGGAVERTAE